MTDTQTRRSSSCKLLAAFATVFVMAACDDSTDDAYHRGYDDGWNETCGAVYDYSRRIYQNLVDEGIC